MFADLLDELSDEEKRPVQRGASGRSAPVRRGILGQPFSQPRAKRTGFILTLDEAIEAEIDEIRSEENKFMATPQPLSSSRLRERAEFIKKFIGDYSCFRQTDDVEPKDLEKFFIERVRSCSALLNEERRLERNEEEDEEGVEKWIATEEEENWLNIHYQHVARILLRTKEPMRLYQKAWINKSSFAEVARGCIPMQQIEDLITKLEKNVYITTEHEHVLKKEIHGATCMAADLNFPNEHLNDWVKDITDKIEALMLEPEDPEIFDDPPPILTHVEEIPFPEFLGDEEEEQPIPSASTQCRSILMKKPGVYYSDRDIYRMTDAERIKYTGEYLKRNKKTVTFSEAYPQCRLVISNHLKTIIDDQKLTMGIQKVILYPRDYTDFYVGERYASTMKISYSKYREMSWVMKGPYATATMNVGSTAGIDPVPLFKEIRARRVPSEKPIGRPDGENPAQFLFHGVAIPAHNYVLPRALKPIVDQNKLMDYNISSLIKFGNFWQPSVKKGIKSAYNFCYGTAIISDCILEEAHPGALDTAGIFCFPQPLDEIAIYTWIDSLKPEQFSIRNIVFVWGYENLNRGITAMDTAVKLHTLYNLIRTRMDLKYEEFTERGFIHLEKPKYWFSTIPLAQHLKAYIVGFNDLVRKFVTRFDKLEDNPVGLIDWAEACKKNDINPICITNAKKQLSVFYECLKDKIGVRKIRSNKEKVNDINTHRDRQNQIEWAEKIAQQKKD